jgi:hypothetical protein
MNSRIITLILGAIPASYLAYIALFFLMIAIISLVNGHILVIASIIGCLWGLAGAVGLWDVVICGISKYKLNQTLRQFIFILMGLVAHFIYIIWPIFQSEFWPMEFMEYVFFTWVIVSPFCIAIWLLILLGKILMNYPDTKDVWVS